MKVNKKSKSVLAYSTAGLQLAIILTVFVLGGYKLDVRYNSSPIFILVGSFLGMGLGLYNLLRGLKEIDKINAKDDSNDDRRNKWL